MADGGWNCEQENGSTRRVVPHDDQRARGPARARASDRRRRPRSPPRGSGARSTCSSARLLRRLSTGEIIDPAFSRFSFPTGYHYDVLRALDYLRAAGVAPDARMAEAIGMVESKRDADGRWPLEHPHDEQLDVDIGEVEGEPSRWITLRAMRVLRWYDGR